MVPRPVPGKGDRESSQGTPSWPDRISSLALEGIAQGGDAVGRYQGRVVFARGGLPGEIVSLHLTQTHKSFARGVVEAVHTAAPERVRPGCPLFDRCGGCQWQYIDYPAQLAFKRIIVEEQCRHLISSPATVLPTVGMEEPWNYRSTAQLRLAPDGRLGYYAWHSHDLVPLERCPLLVEPLNERIPPLARALQALAPAERPEQVTLRYSWEEDRCLLLIDQGSRGAACRLRDRLQVAFPEVAWQRGRGIEVLAGQGFLHESLAGAPLRVSSRSFFQVNVPQARSLLQTVHAMLDPLSGEHLLDAYAGVGALSLSLFQGQSLQAAWAEGVVRAVGRVTAIESHPDAVKDLRANARRWGEDRVEVFPGTVERLLPGLGWAFDLVVLDPPRRGCQPEVLAAVAAGRPRRIAYVSCHPGTLARDLPVLLGGGYRLVRIQPLDLFPQTFHVESVALLERVG